MLMQRAVTVLAIAFCLTVAFQAYELIAQHANLQVARGDQEASLEQAVQVREDTEALAGETAVLADKGNADAKQVVDFMRQQGIALRAPQAPGGAPTVAPTP
jgi:Icc-related predicted phosphoesterase